MALICLILTWSLQPVWGDDKVSQADEPPTIAVKVGEPQWLEAGGERFLGIFTKATSAASLGGAIILPSLGKTPDWPDVIAPLRKTLPAYGWNTLSIQLPYPTKNADGLWQLEPYFTASRGRIQSAINYLRQQGITNIVLIGHGLGAATAAVCVSGNDPLPVAGLAAISLGTLPGSDRTGYGPDLLENIHVPVLDIFGSRDFTAVTATAAARVAAARRGGLAALRSQQLGALKQPPQARLLTTNHNGYIGYRQVILTGADHSFRGAGATLIKRIAGWLKKHAEAGDSNILASGAN